MFLIKADKHKIYQNHIISKLIGGKVAPKQVYFDLIKELLNLSETALIEI